MINGPNLNMLGNRDKGLYGSYSLETIQDQVVAIGEKVGLEVECFQSNSEGDIIDFLQEKLFFYFLNNVFELILLEQKEIVVRT